MKVSKMEIDRIFIFEFISGGGFNHVDIPISLFTEGFGMLRVIVEDFKNLGFQIKTLIDHRIQHMIRYLKTDFSKEINQNMDIFLEVKNAVKDCKYVFIIAPEFSGILYNLTKIMKDQNKIILSMSLEAIRLGSSKFETYKYFKAQEVSTPLTYHLPSHLLHKDHVMKIILNFKLPVIIKPEDGVGAENIFYFENKSQISSFFTSNRSQFESDRDYIIQEYVSGKDLSVSIIENSQGLNILSINAQFVEISKLNSNSSYLGGYTPISDYENVRKNLKKQFRQLNLIGFTGYYGIDFIRKTDNSLSFIEINPRLTTSYVGIRNITKKNPLLLILHPDIDVNNVVDSNHEYLSHFFHLRLRYVGELPLTEVNEGLIPQIMKEIPHIVSPPLALNEDSLFACFIATKAKNLRDSKKQENRLISALEKKEFRVIK
ncbi:MAG: ATP-grasp domain-containing protein [Promethearchaeota archaeon]